MPEQKINIEKVESGGVFNIYNSSDSNVGKKEASIYLNAVDKYSSPLLANLNTSRWGDSLYRVSFVLKNDLLGQVLQRNYITVKSEKDAEDLLSKISSKLEDFKKEAELNRKHSTTLISEIWKYMEDLEKKSSIVEQPESKDLQYRYQIDFSQSQGAKPSGMTFYDPEHFPGHYGIVRKASKNKKGSVDSLSSLNSYNKSKIREFQNLKILASSMLDLIGSKSLDLDLLRNNVHSLLPRFDDDYEVSQLKRMICAQISPLIRGRFIKSSNLIKSFEDMEYLGTFGAAFHSEKKISIDDYDTIIFDADFTIWEGDKAYEMDIPFTVEGNRAFDAKGTEIVLRKDIKYIIRSLSEQDKNLGVVSRSEKEGVEMQDQPVVHLLRSFGLLQYFNKMVVVAKDLPKSMFMPQNERVLLVDDKESNLVEVLQHADVDVTTPDKIKIKYNDDEEEEVEEKDFDSYINHLAFTGRHEDIDFIERQGSIYEFVKESDLNYRIVKSNKFERENIIGDCVNSFDEDGYCINDSLPYGDVTDFAQDEENDFERLKKNGIDIFYDDEEDIHYFYFKKESNSNDWYKIFSKEHTSYKTAKRPRIKSKEIPEKPKGKGEYELDHKKPRWKGGTDTKDNLEWIPKKKHKKKTQEEGSYEYGGKDRHQSLKKEKGKDGYSEYQSNTGKAKVEKERKEIGEKAFSRLQSERAKKRWKNKKANHDGMFRYSVVYRTDEKITPGELDFVMSVNIFQLPDNLFDQFLKIGSSLIWCLDDAFLDKWLVDNHQGLHEECSQEVENEEEIQSCKIDRVKTFRINNLDEISDVQSVITDVKNSLFPKLNNLIDEINSSDSPDQSFLMNRTFEIFQEILNEKGMGDWGYELKVGQTLNEFSSQSGK